MTSFCNTEMYKGRVLHNELKKHESSILSISDGEIDSLFERNSSNKKVLRLIKTSLYNNIDNFIRRIILDNNSSDTIDDVTWEICLLLSKFMDQEYVYDILEKMFNNTHNAIDHAFQVALTSLYLSIKHKVPTTMAFNITVGSLLCDAGMIEIFSTNPELSYASRNYTLDEYDIIKNHPVVGYDMLDEIKDVPNEVKKIVLLHHVWENSSGNELTGFNRSYPCAYRGNIVDKRIKDLPTNIVQLSDQFNSILKNERMCIDELVSFIQNNVNVIYNISANTLFKYISPVAVGEKYPLHHGTNPLVVDTVEVIALTDNLTRPIIKTKDCAYVDLRDRKYDGYHL